MNDKFKSMLSIVLCLCLMHLPYSVKTTTQAAYISSIVGEDATVAHTTAGSTNDIEENLEVNCTANVTDNSVIFEENTTISDTFVLPSIHNMTADNKTCYDNNTNINATDVTITTQVKTYRDYPHYKVYTFMKQFSPFIINYLGFVGNFFTLLTALRMKHTPTNVCIITLAGTDMSTCIMRAVYTHLHPRDFLNEFYCRSVNYLYTFFTSYSNFILVCWTFERLVAVAYPVKLQAWCTLRNTKIALALACGLAVLISFMFIPTVTFREVVVSPTLSYKECVASEILLEKLIHVANTFYIWGPMVLIVVCNATIIGIMAKHRKSQATMTSNMEIQHKRAAEQRRMTIVLVSISVTFLLFHLPYTVKVIIESFIDPPITYGAYFFAQYLVWSTFIIYWLQLQNVVNFIVYCLTGPKFRKSFMNLLAMIFCFCCRRDPIKLEGERITTISELSTSKYN